MAGSTAHSDSASQSHPLHTSHGLPAAAPPKDRPQANPCCTWILIVHGTEPDAHPLGHGATAQPRLSRSESGLTPVAERLDISEARSPLTFSISARFMDRPVTSCACSCAGRLTTSEGCSQL